MPPAPSPSSRPARGPRLAAALLVALAATALPARALDAQYRGLVVAHVVDERTTGPGEHFTLVPDAGAARPLLPADAGAREALLRVTGGEAFVDASPWRGDTLRVSGARPVAGRPADVALSVQRAGSVATPYRILTVLCRFPDAAPLAEGPAHFERLMGTAAPGVRAFLERASYGRLATDGSRVTGWVSTTRLRTDYYTGNGTGLPTGSPFGSTFARDTAFANDCLRAAVAADPSIDVGQFEVVNVQHNANLSASYAYLGPVRLVRPGTTTALSIRLAFEASWAARAAGTHAHEIGHTLGFHHAGGNGEYDSRWTVMSSSSGGTLDGLSYGSPFLAFERERRAWLDAGEIRSVGAGASDSLVLRALDGARAGTKLVRLPLDASRAITLEYRVRGPAAGHPDWPIPFSAVVLHEVTGTQARVLDANANGNVNDAGSALVAGGTWVDTTRILQVRVVALADSGAVVVVDRRTVAVPLAVRDTVRRPYAVARATADTIVATGGARPAGAVPAFTLVDGAVPRGMTLAASGIIAGTPADTGAWTATVRVTLPADTALVRLSGRVTRAVTLASRRWRDSVAVRDAIRDTLRATSTSGALTWRLLDGALPAGLTLSGAGIVSGTVTAAATTSGRIEVRSTGGDADTLALAVRAVRLPFTARVVADTATIVEGDSLRLVLAFAGGDAGAATLAIEEAPALDTLRVGGAAPHTAGTTVVQGVARGPGSRVLRLRATIGADTVRLRHEWTVLPLVSEVAGLPDRVTFGDTLRATPRWTTRRPATVTLRRDVPPLARSATIDTTGALLVVADRLGGDTLRLAVDVVRPNGYRARGTVTRAIDFARLRLDAAPVLRTLVGADDALGARERAFLDAQGNRNGRADLGDVRAWLVAEGLLRRDAPTAQVVPALQAAAKGARLPAADGGTEPVTTPEPRP